GMPVTSTSSGRVVVLDRATPVAGRPRLRRVLPPTPLRALDRAHHGGLAAPRPPLRSQDLPAVRDPDDRRPLPRRHGALRAALRAAVPARGRHRCRGRLPVPRQRRGKRQLRLAGLLRGADRALLPLSARWPAYADDGRASMAALSVASVLVAIMSSGVG